MSVVTDRILIMNSTEAADIVHQLYHNSRALDLIPCYGTNPGRDEATGERYAGHDLDELLQGVKFGLPACITCASTEAPDAFSPLILNEDHE